MHAREKATAYMCRKTYCRVVGRSRRYVNPSVRESPTVIERLSFAESLGVRDSGYQNGLAIVFPDVMPCSPNHLQLSRSTKSHVM